jgi:hypothetical protein
MLFHFPLLVAWKKLMMHFVSLPYVYWTPNFAPCEVHCWKMMH